MSVIRYQNLTMKRINTKGLALLTFFLIILGGCSKESVQQNLLVDAVTNGRWIVVAFTEGSNDVSSEFSPYEFQFYQNNTVQAINGSTVITGSWVADINARTISASFPGSNTTLNRLNDNWKIFNNSFTLVEANPVNTARTAYLKLNKK